MHDQGIAMHDQGRTWPSKQGKAWQERAREGLLFKQFSKGRARKGKAMARKGRSQWCALINCNESMKERQIIFPFLIRSFAFAPKKYQRVCNFTCLIYIRFDQ
jgi:hypothetical protein